MIKNNFLYKKKYNLKCKKTIKTLIKNIFILINNKCDYDIINKALIKTQSYIDKKSNKKIIHKNKASRYISKIYKMSNLLKYK